VVIDGLLQMQQGSEVEIIAVPDKNVASSDSSKAGSP
jgi:hypothetical protein